MREALRPPPSSRMRLPSSGSRTSMPCDDDDDSDDGDGEDDEEEEEVEEEEEEVEAEDITVDALAADRSPFFCS